MSVAIEYPPIHVLTYGDFGAGKSTFAATFPKPQIVFCFDAYGKETPYYRGGTVSELFSDDKADFVRTVIKNDTVIRRIEYYHDIEFVEPLTIQRKAGVSVQDVNPTAYKRFLSRMAKFQHEYGDWATAILDSVTSMEISARRWDQFTLNPRAEDGRQWYGAAKDFLERMLIGRFGQLPMNVVVIAHVDDEKYESHGKQKRMPMAPGKLRGSLGSQYGNVFHQFVNDNGERLLQTQEDAIWCCTTSIDAPEFCIPSYKELWANWNK